MSDDGTERNRSVVDFDSEDALRKALLADDTNSEAITGESDLSSSSSPNLDWVLPNLDHSTSDVQSMKEELQRLLVLKSYLILDNDREESFERITALGARIFEAPICLVSLVDLGRQWFLSNRGLGSVRETPRRLAFCAHAIQMRDKRTFVVPNATDDPIFASNPLVTGPPNIRFYAGAPLVAPEGYKVRTGYSVLSDW
jgi:GAF domain-containing protein